MNPASEAAFFDPFYKCLPVPIVILKPSAEDLRIVYTNPAFLQRTGISRDLTGSVFREVMIEDLGADGTYLENMDARSGLMFPQDFRIAPRMGQELPFIGFFLNRVDAALEGDFVCGIFDSGSQTSPGAQREHEKILSLLGQIEELTQFGTWEIDLATLQLKWSEGMFRITGYRPDEIELTKENGFAILHPDDRHPISVMIERAKADRQGIYAPLRLITKDGSIRHIISRGMVICENNEPIRLFGVSQDVTEQVLNHKVVEDIRTHYQTLVQSVDGIFWEADAASFRFSYISPQVERILGYTPEEWIGDPEFWQKHIVPEDRDDAIQYCHVESTAGRDHQFEYRMFARDGSVVWMQDIVSVTMENGRATKLRGLMVNISDKKAAELRQQQLYEELDARALELTASNRELEQFAYIASHDLQEPLRMVTSFLTQLERKYNNLLDDKGRQYIHYAVDGAARMRQIILDLLEFSRVGRIDVPEETVDLNALMEEIRELFSDQLAESNGQFLYEPMPTIVALRASLLQVLQNLVSNALKYHSPDRPPVVQLAVNRDGRFWHFTVADNGIGIEQEYFEKIFVIFQRLHPKHEYSGSGIGLAICKKIADNLGGKIHIASEPGKGSTFHFLLPVRKLP